MSKLLQMLGIKTIAVGVDFNAFLLGVKYTDDEETVEDDPEASALFFFLGPAWILFIL